MDYKTILAQIIDNRPSGTRQRLAAGAWQAPQFRYPDYKRKFGPPTPLPARHLATIFRVCHFSPVEQRPVCRGLSCCASGRLTRIWQFRRIALTVADGSHLGMTRRIVYWTRRLPILSRKLLRCWEYALAEMNSRDGLVVRLRFRLKGRELDQMGAIHLLVLRRSKTLRLDTVAAAGGAR